MRKNRVPLQVDYRRETYSPPGRIIRNICSGAYRSCREEIIAMDRWIADLCEKHFKEYGKPLFSSHMLDLSEESIKENIETCKRYLERMSRIGMTLEIELGVTGEKRTVLTIQY